MDALYDKRAHDNQREGLEDGARERVRKRGDAIL